MLLGLGVIAGWMYNNTATQQSATIPEQPQKIIVQPETSMDSESTEFTDGLGTPFQTTKYELDDMGAGVAQIDVFKYDINGDGILDRITRTHNENCTAHAWDEYKIEMNVNGTWTDITPDNFRTIEGAECALQKIQFQFVPQFQIVKISRPWQDSWITPTQATRTQYKSSGNNIVAVSEKPSDTVCDVTELFNK